MIESQGFAFVAPGFSLAGFSRTDAGLKAGATKTQSTTARDRFGPRSGGL
jgi:hypothetical protein